MVLDVQRRTQVFSPVPSSGSASNAAPQMPVDGAAAVEDTRPMELRQAAWVEREAEAPSLAGTGTGDVAADRAHVKNIGAPGATQGPGPDAGAGWDSALAEGARARTTGVGSDRILLAQNRAGPGRSNIATDAPTGPLVGMTPTGANGPGAPLDVARLTAVNARVQSFNVSRSVVPAADVRAVQQQFQVATDAARRGDYAAAERALNQLGFPLPQQGGAMNPAASTTAYVLGAAQGSRSPGGGWQVSDFRYGAHGDQSINDVNGFAANARLMNRFTAAGIRPSANPPSEAQTLDYMRQVSQPSASGARPDAATVMARAGEVVDGSIVHYSSADAQNPQYDANPNPRFFFRDRAGTPQVFDTEAAARHAAAQQHPPIRNIARLNARSPDAWSDISSMGSRAGRNIGDCESKLYMQQRLLTQAGFRSLGSIDVQPANGGTGHMLGAFCSPDGRVFVTSNETFQEVRGTGPRGAVTRADLDATVRAMTADVYHVRPNAAGVRDTSGFRFSSAPTDPSGTADAAVLSIRRASENGMMRRSEPLLAD